MVYYLKRLTSLIIALVLILCMSAPVLAATFYAYILVTEDDGNSYDMLAMSATTNVTYMAENGYTTANGTDVQVQIGSTEYARMLATDNVNFAAPIPNNSSTQFELTTGNTPEDFEIVIGHDGYYTIGDFNMGTDNFTWEWDGYFDADATGNISYKEDAYSANTTGGVVTVAILDGLEQTAQDGNGNIYTGNPVRYAQRINSLPFCTVQEVSFYLKKTGTPAGTGYARLRKQSDDSIIGTFGTIDVSTLTAGYIWYTFTTDVDNTAVQDVYFSFEWTGGDAGKHVNIGYKNANVCDGVLSYYIAAWADQAARDLCIDYTITLAEVTTDAISDGEHTITTSMDSPFLSLGVDATSDPIADPITPVATDLVLNAPLWQTECSGSPFTTIDGNALTSTVSGAVWTLNEGYEFDGVDDYIEVAHDASQLLSTGGSIEAWIKATTAGENNAGFVINKGTGGFGEDGYLLYTAPDNRLTFNISGGAGIQSAINSVVQGDGNFYHVIITWTNTGLTTFYINGVVSGTPGIVADPAGIINTGPLYLGNLSAGATVRTFDGLIGEVRLYNVELSAADVLRNYNATKSKYDTGDIYTYSTLASVPDNGNDIVENTGNVFPYLEYVKKWVGGALVAWYQPNTIIESDEIPDRAGDDNPAAITWGANPSGVTVSLGSLALSGEAMPGGLSLTSPDALGPAGEPYPIHLDDYELEGGAHEFAPIVDDIASLSNIPSSMIWAFIAVLVSLLALVMVRKHLPSTLAAGLVAAAALGIFTAIGAESGLAAGIEWWQPAVVVLATLATVAMQKTQTI